MSTAEDSVVPNRDIGHVTVTTIGSWTKEPTKSIGSMTHSDVQGILHMRELDRVVSQLGWIPGPVQASRPPTRFTTSTQ